MGIVGSKEGSWQCQHCTLDNDISWDTCAACHLARGTVEVSGKATGRSLRGWTCAECYNDNTFEDKTCEKCKKRNKPLERLTSHGSLKWHCTRCTYMNPERLPRCEVCFHARDGQTNTDHTNRGDSATGKDLWKEENMDTSCDDQSRAATGKGEKGIYYPELRKKSPRPYGDRKPRSPRRNLNNEGIKTKDSTQWRCKVCTFLNSELVVEKCEMCDTVRPSSVPAERPDSRAAKRHFLQQQKSMKIVDLQNLEEMEAMKRWTHITNFCRETKTQFTDDSFPPNKTSLYLQPYVKDTRDPRWLRCRDVKSRTSRDNSQKWVVYRDKPSPGDIEQGNLGNCWYLSALAVLADRKELLEKIILTKTFCEQGAYHVRLCKDGRWKIVLVDDVFPSDQYNRLLYSEGRRKQLWVPLIEKAAAKLYGCYEALTAGRTIEALALLTGEPCDCIELQETHADDHDVSIKRAKVWSQIVNAKESNFLMGTSCGSGRKRTISGDQYKKVGLINNHAYSLLDAQDVQGNQLVKIRNPWGKDSWTGDWSDNSPMWSTISVSAKRAFQHNENRSGIFWMSLEDFMKYFYSVDICKARSGWQEVRIKGVFPPHAGHPWKFVTLAILERTQMDICLFQKSFRGKNSIKESHLDLLIVVMENNINGPNVFRRVVSTSRRSGRSFVGCEVDLEPGAYTIACMAFKHWQTDKNRMGILHSREAGCAFFIAARFAAMKNAHPIFVYSSIDRTITGRIRHAQSKSEDDLHKDFVLTIHSSKMILSEEVDSRIPAFKTALADILIQLAIQKGKRQELNGQGLVLYELWWYGTIHVVENTNARYYAKVQCDSSSSSYQVTTRDFFVTRDCIPPKHRQVVTVLTPLDASNGWSTHRLITHVMEPIPGLSGWGAPNVQHIPAITYDLEALHMPRPI